MSNIKRYREEKEVGEWAIRVEYNEVAGAAMWDVMISPECGWIYTCARTTTKKDAMHVYRGLRKTEEIKRLYIDAKIVRDKSLREVFGPVGADTIHLAEKVMGETTDISP